MALNALVQEPRWVAWRNELRGGKITKVPYGPDGKKAKADDPTTWGSCAEAEATARKLVNGLGGRIGIELGDLGGDIHLAGIDLDGCLSEDGKLAAWAEVILDLVGSYTEISPSGRGLKSFFYVASEDVRLFLDRIGAQLHQWGVRRDVPGEDARNHGPAVEVYLARRYFTVTGSRWPSAPDRPALLDRELLERLASLIPPARSGGDHRRKGGGDNSRSAIAFRKGGALRRAGKTFEEMCEALRGDPETAEWCREKGDAQGGRELRRIWEKPETGSGPVDRQNGVAPGGTAAAPARQRVTIGSDVEIAERVACDFRRTFGEVVFADGDFWRYVGTHWQPFDTSTLRQAVHLYDGAIYKSPSDKPAAVKLSKGRVDSVLHEMGAKLARPDYFADAPPGINCSSGFITFEVTGEARLLPHDRDHRCRQVLPGQWEPSIAGKEPPADSLIGRLLGGVFKDDPDEAAKRTLLGEIAGAAALGYATKLRQPKAVVLKGEKAENGKSQILDLIRGLMPASAIASVTAAKIGDERFIVGLRSKLLNAADELSGSAAIASDAFKAVVTGEPVTGRDVYRSAITFRPSAQHVFATNTLPTFAGGMDRGVQRRLLVITFNRVIPVKERIEQIGIRIGEEEPDLLLAWAVAGATRLIPQRQFTVPESSALALRDWLFGADPVLAWTEARVRARDAPEGGYKSGYAHARFKEWALANGFRDNTIPAVNGFVQLLQANIPSAVVKHTSSGNWLRGIEILLVDPRDDQAQDG
jgi:phage/plasmid-associated DNA primase